MICVYWNPKLMDAFGQHNNIKMLSISTILFLHDDSCVAVAFIGIVSLSVQWNMYVQWILFTI